MEGMKKWKESEKGSITMFVLTAMLFMLMILGISYFGISNKATSQNHKIENIGKEYQNSNEEMEQVYRETLNQVSLTIEQAQNDSMFQKTENTQTMDSNGNRIQIPAGFKVTKDTTEVTKGIVIEDIEGNQFVWIPVGDIYTNREGTEKKTITLGRYHFASDGIPSEYTGNYQEENSDKSENLLKYGNKIAKEIERFKLSAKQNGGYYIGRYEAGDQTATINGVTNLEGIRERIVCKAQQVVYNHVTQPQASTLSQEMYENYRFTSDLMNSYAWDTAIAFIQEFSGDNQYANQKSIQSTLARTGEATNGTNKDVRCNIFDMAGNVYEYTTETGTSEYPCVARGDSYKGENDTTAERVLFGTLQSSDNLSFRPILYF